jgi:hypothetical protein
MKGRRVFKASENSLRGRRAGYSQGAGAVARSSVVTALVLKERSRPASADRAPMRWQVGLTTVPAAATTVSSDDLFPSWRDESSGVAGPQERNRRWRRRHFASQRGFPTARLPEHGLRGNLDYEPPLLAATALCGGGATGHRQKASRLYGAAKCSLLCRCPP